MYLSNLVVNTVRFVYFTLYRLSVTEEFMFAVLHWHILIQLARCKFYAFHRFGSHGHGCNCILVCGETGRERGCIHTRVWKKPVKWSKIGPKFGWYGKVN